MRKLRFVERTTEASYIDIFKGNGCYSYVGKVGSFGQSLSLGNGCLRKAIVLHELMHALGNGSQVFGIKYLNISCIFLGAFHTQSRPDRDNYVNIHLENVLSGLESNFAKQSNTNMFGSYDFCSMMHYNSKAFTKVNQILPPKKISSHKFFFGPEWQWHNKH